MKKLVLIVVLLSITRGDARLVRTWTHRELAEAATTIAIIEAVSTEKATAPLPAGFPEAADNYQAWITTFKVHVGLKGALDTNKQLKILHFSYSDKMNVINNGAMFMRFTIGPVKQDIKFSQDGGGTGTVTQNEYHPVWLAYLKSSLVDTALFESATGQYDASLAYKEISDYRLH